MSLLLKKKKIHPDNTFLQSKNPRVWKIGNKILPPVAACHLPGTPVLKGNDCLSLSGVAFSFFMHIQVKWTCILSLTYFFSAYFTLIFATFPSRNIAWGFSAYWPLESILILCLWLQSILLTERTDSNWLHWSLCWWTFRSSQTWTLSGKASVNNFYAWTV